MFDSAPCPLSTDLIAGGLTEIHANRDEGCAPRDSAALDQRLETQRLGATSERPLRVALYSHDTQGLGHVRRNLAIAASFAQSQEPPTTLLVAGTAVASSFQLPEGTDLLSLPAMAKDKAGEYSVRGLRMPRDQVIRLRAQIIHTALANFAPDVLIVDKVPAGLQNELLPALRLLHRQGARCVLGLRDILDDPATACQEWESMHYTKLINKYYDRVWIYGDPTVYDAIREYKLPRSVAAKVCFTGYIDRTRLLPLESDGNSANEVSTLLPQPGQRLAVCMVGGGEDGGPIAVAFTQAILPPNTQGVLIVGPNMPAALRQELAAATQARSDLKVVDFIPNPEQLLRHAHVVISMGGYNSLCEILANRKRALIIPRVFPRREQWERAQRLQALQAVHVLAPDEVTPTALSTWLADQFTRESSVAHTIDMDGLHRLPQLLREVVAGRERPSRRLVSHALRFLEYATSLFAVESLVAYASLFAAG